MATRKEVFALAQEHLPGVKLTGKGVTLAKIRLLLRDKGILSSEVVTDTGDYQKPRSDEKDRQFFIDTVTSWKPEEIKTYISQQPRFNQETIEKAYDSLVARFDKAKEASVHHEIASVLSILQPFLGWNKCSPNFLYMASHGCNMEVLEEILSQAKNLPDQTLEKALEISVNHDGLEGVTKRLLEHGVKPKVEDLLISVRYASLDLVESLFEVYEGNLEDYKEDLLKGATEEVRGFLESRLGL